MKQNDLMLDESNERLDRLRSEMEEIQDYLKEPKKAPVDDDAKAYRQDFVPLYAKYSGTKKLLPAIKEFLKTHDLKRKEDFCMQFTMMWIYHIMLCHKYHNLDFKPEDIFKIRIPKTIKDLGK